VVTDPPLPPLAIRAPLFQLASPPLPPLPVIAPALPAVPMEIGIVPPE